MARILFTTAPMVAHVRPTVPLVHQLTQAGHEVSWYTGEALRDTVEAAGATLLPAADLQFDRRVHDVAGDRGFRGLNRLVLELFIKPIPDYVADLRPKVAELRPDVVVFDHSFRAGLFVAETLGIPSVAFSAGPMNLSSADTAPFGLGWAPAKSWIGRARNRCLNALTYRVLYRERAQLLASIRSELGLPQIAGYSVDWVAAAADQYLQTGIAEFEYPRRDLPDSVVFIGPTQMLAADDAARPGWWPDVAQARAAGRPIVFVTQGTIATDLADLVLPAISALADSEALVIATTSGQDPEQVWPAAERPANLRLDSFVSYPALLPLVDLMITNGGYGGVQTALMYGIPLVVAGTSQDRMETNSRVAWCGAGISLRSDRPRPRAIARAASRILDQPEYRANAERLQRIFQQYEGGSRAAEAILQVACSR